jgi:hypothetical protein
MPNESTAKKIFKDVRALYEAGFKSSNKSYDDDDSHVSWWKRISGKAKTRRQNQPTAKTELSGIRGTATYKTGGVLNAGKILYEQGVSAANCGDLAALACHIAHTKYNVPADQLGRVGVYTKNKSVGKKGADHAFAIYGSATDLYSMAHRDELSIELIDRHVLYRGIFAIDPWANLYCTLDKYPSKAADKMRSWGAYGKRVLWVYTLNNDSNFSSEWCSPDGAYLTVFSEASLRVELCG